MRSRLVLFVTLLTILVACVAGAESSGSEENTRHRIKSVSGLSKEEAERLVERVWQDLSDKRDYERVGIYDYEYASIMVADVDGDGQEEVIVAVSVVQRGEGVIAVFRKQGEEYALCDQISCGGSVEIKAVDLFGDGRQALVIESLDGGAKWGRSTVRVYQWGKEGFAKIWEGVTTEDGFSPNSKYNTDAEVQFTDLNRDGVREIVRIGVVYKGEWEKQPGLEEAQLPEIGIKTKLYPERLNWIVEIGKALYRDHVDFNEIASGYEAVYEFRETYFYDKEFNRYIQYKARVIQDTKTKEANILERIPIAAGTRVGILGIFSEAYNRVLSLDSSIFVVLPDSRVVQLDRGILERIYQEDQHDK
jgi:hypothetical protein